METWLIVVIVIAVLLLVALLVLLPRMRSRNDAKKQAQAREHVQEAQVRTNRAEQERAGAQEQVAAAQRERAEVEERAALAEREAQARLAHAREEQSRADSLHDRAEQLAPGVSEHPTVDPARHDGSTDQRAGEPLRNPDDPGPAAPRT